MRPYWDEENTFGYLRFDLAEYRSIAAYKTYPKYFQTWEYAQWVYFHRKIQCIICSRRGKLWYDSLFADTLAAFGFI